MRVNVPSATAAVEFAAVETAARAHRVLAGSAIGSGKT